MPEWMRFISTKLTRPPGRFLVDNTTAIEGVMLLEQELCRAYPQLAIQTELFNPMASRAASFAISDPTMFFLGHPAGRLHLPSIQSNFLPEGYFYSPMYPALHGGRGELGLHASRRPMCSGGATDCLRLVRFQDYELTPAPRMPLKRAATIGFPRQERCSGIL